MKTKKLIFLTLFVALLFAGAAHAQNGYIYVHLKSINEQSSTDFPFVLKNSSGTTVSSFSLNDQATYDNTSTYSSNHYFTTLDLGVSHGTGGDGQLWAITSTSLVTPYSKAGTIYVRAAGSSNWTSTGVTTAIAVDGAYANQCVYVNSSGNVYFYNNGTSTQIYSGGNATDVTANGGRIAIIAGSFVELYSASYSAGTAPVTTGATWSMLTAANTTSRLDMNLAGNLIVFLTGGSNTVKTVDFSHTVTTLTSPGTTGQASANGIKVGDIAYDDLGYIYAIVADAAADPIVYSYNGSAWTAEYQARELATVTGGAAHMAFGQDIEDGLSVANIFSRQTDNAGNIYWIDDDRVKSSSAYNGNGIVIPVSPGTYTLTETLPSNGYDLGRYNIYDPGGSSTGNVNTQVITFVVTANEVVFGEYVNEYLVPKAIALTCSFQYLQTFDESTSNPIKTYTYGNGTFGTPVEGTSYHYAKVSGYTFSDDGYYELETSSSNWINSSVTDHTGNGGYFMAINASYASDEFYRQRVTNLVPGVSYTIAFWAVNLSPSASLEPSINFGLQDSLGNIVNTASSGNITSSSWVQFSFTFTATTSRADLFLKNASIGGGGNDVAIDDISINPVYPVLGANTISPTANYLCIGSNYTLSNTLTPGLWTSGNTAVATVNANSGRVRGLTPGTAVITYSYSNAIGCTSTMPTTVTVAATPVVTATAKYATACLGQTDSLYTGFTTTSTAPYTYAWSVSPTTGATLTGTATQNTSTTPSASGSYTFTTVVTDALGCSATASVPVTVTGNTAPTVSAAATITSAACAIPVTLNLSGGVSGSLHPNYSYVWGGPGTIAAPNSGSISATTYNTTATTSAAGSYTLTVTDGNGCVGTATAATAANPLSITTGVYSASECNNTKDSLYSAASGGTAPYSYQWAATTAPGTVAYSPGSTKDTTGVSFTTAGTYQFTVKATDAKGCTNTSPALQIVYVNASGPALSALNAAATKCTGSTINLSATRTGGTSPYTYTWGGTPTTNGVVAANATTTTAVPTAAGAYTYTLKVTDGNGCSASGSTATQTVNASPALQATTQNPAFCGTSGTAQLYAVASGGSGTYSSYAWSTAVVSGSGTTSLSSTSMYNPVASISGASTGNSFKYTATVTDNNGCTATASTTAIAVATSPSVTSVTATASSSCASNTNSIALSGSVTGGSTPYSYAWTPPSNSTVTPASGSATASPITASATATVAQNYTFGLQVADANNCVASGSDAASPVVISSTLSVSASASTAGPICASPTTGINLTSSASGGSGSYTYAWAGPGGTITTATSQNPTAVPTTTGTYTVTVNDGTGCTGTGTTGTVTVDQATPSISITCGTNSSGINYAQLNETNGVSWYWTTTSGGRFYTTNALSASNDAATSTLEAPYIDYNGTYAVAITDANGCNGSGSITLTSSSCNNILATSNLNFTVEKQGSAALLNWNTASETNNSYFNIERSGDGVTWQVIGNVKGQGNSTVITKYSFTDGLPLEGTNYYRLKQVDVNGEFNYSPVKYLVFTGQWLVKLYPNPVQNYLVLEFNNDRDEKANIIIQSVLGNTVFAAEQQLAKGLNRIVLNQVQLLATGTYMLVMGTTENTFRSKFVKGGN